jgi:hypothetical protein
MSSLVWKTDSALRNFTASPGYNIYWEGIGEGYVPMMVDFDRKVKEASAIDWAEKRCGFRPVPRRLE